MGQVTKCFIVLMYFRSYQKEPLYFSLNFIWARYCSLVMIASVAIQTELAGTRKWTSANAPKVALKLEFQLDPGPGRQLAAERRTDASRRQRRRPARQIQVRKTEDAQQGEIHFLLNLCQNNILRKNLSIGKKLIFILLWERKKEISDTHWRFFINVIWSKFRLNSVSTRSNNLDAKDLKFF